MTDCKMDKYAITGLVTVAGFHQLVGFTRAVGQARHKYGVDPPATDGAPEFNRTFRAHQNTLESYPISLTSLWMASGFFHPVPASIAYMGYLYSRHKYFHGYVESAEKRIPGIHLSFHFLKALFFMCFLGVGHKAVRHYGNVDLLELISKHIPNCD